MDRAGKVGIGVAVVGHVVLFGALSLGFLAHKEPAKPLQPAVEVSLVKDVGLEATAPAAVEPPAQSIAPEQGAPEDAAPPEAEAPASKPVPEPKPVPAGKPQPQPKPVVKPVPQDKPAPVKPAPKPPAPTVKPAPAVSPAKSAAASKPSRAPAVARPAAAAKGNGANPAATAARAKGSRLGKDFLKGLTSDPSPGKAEVPRAAKIDARALAGIQDAISRQIQPCADRQVDPGPGANAIVTVLNLKLNQDGTLAATPTMVRQTGVDGENGRYAQRVVDLGIAAFKGCSPLKLPAEFYSTPNGGWNNINYKWQLR